MDFTKIINSLGPRGQKILDFMVNKAHTTIGVIYGAILLAYYMKTHRDLPPGMVSATYAFYGFLLGHAGIYQKWPDQDSTPPTT